ncbi:GTP-binding protein YPTM2-like, partial [Stegodyphus dumicola]|uniref:GTP-binding protein YPTM2-like n=1 Tax=Stegodyphus dumicola TaxID=202533 RepID=UPI0015A7D38C
LILSFSFPEHMNHTVVADCRDVNITFHGETIKLVIWDTAGQERFKAIVRSYYRMADGVLLVYDVTDYATFSMVSGWLSDLRTHNDEADVLIVGNKNEDPAKKAVTASVVSKICPARRYGLPGM